MVPLDLDAVGAAWTTGNLHKWVCAPKGAGFLHARADRQPGIRPNTISHGANQVLGDRGATTRYRAEFDWQGTLDPTPWLATTDALDVVGGLVDGGWPAVISRNRALARRGRDALTKALGLAPSMPAPDDMLGAMVALPLPASGPLATAGWGSSPLDTDPLQQRLLDECRIEVPIYPWPVPAAEPPDAPRRLIRISAALHNGPDDAERLAAALASIRDAG
jgi:isopenicillin-N epimerase